MHAKLFSPAPPSFKLFFSKDYSPRLGGYHHLPPVQWPQKAPQRARVRCFWRLLFEALGEVRYGWVQNVEWRLGLLRESWKFWRGQWKVAEVNWKSVFCLLRVKVVVKLVIQNASIGAQNCGSISVKIPVGQHTEKRRVWIEIQAFLYTTSFFLHLYSLTLPSPPASGPWCFPGIHWQCWWHCRSRT